METSILLVYLQYCDINGEMYDEQYCPPLGISCV